MIYCASSVSRHWDNGLKQEFEGKVFARPGLSLINLTPSKNVFKIILDQEVDPGIPKVLWHDALNNSLSKHPTQPTNPLNEEQLLLELRKLKLLNFVAVVYVKREGALNLNDKLSDIATFMTVLNMRNVLTTKWRREIECGGLHFSIEVERHMLSRVIECNSFHELTNRRHACTRKKQSGRKGTRRVQENVTE